MKHYNDSLATSNNEQFLNEDSNNSSPSTLSTIISNNKPMKTYSVWGTTEDGQPIEKRVKAACMADAVESLNTLESPFYDFEGAAEVHTKNENENTNNQNTNTMNNTNNTPAQAGATEAPAASRLYIVANYSKEFNTWKVAIFDFATRKEGEHMSCRSALAALRASHLLRSRHHVTISRNSMERMKAAYKVEKANKMHTEPETATA